MDLPRVPAKIQALLDYATKHGMVVEFDTKLVCWEIRSGKPLDRDRIWVYWNGPGANGGRTSINLYRPYAKRKPSRMTKLTFKSARTWVWVLSR